eukprot:900560-Lingulodinium_polyedra.AAC.1
MQFAISDKAFLVGNEVVQRRDGWPMGGCVSAAATSITIEHDVARLYSNNNVAHEIGWHCKKMPTCSVVQGIVHVDDSMIMSKTLCSRCIESGALKCWPRDIGMEVEQRAPDLTFLHLTLHVRDEITACPIDFYPSMPNAPFARGEVDFPK